MQYTWLFLVTNPDTSIINKNQEDRVGLWAGLPRSDRAYRGSMCVKGYNYWPHGPRQPPLTSSDQGAEEPRVEEAVPFYHAIGSKLWKHPERQNSGYRFYLKHCSDGSKSRKRGDDNYNGLCFLYLRKAAASSKK